MRLNGEERDVFYYRVWEELSVKEIAGELGVSAAFVESVLKIAFAKLEGELEEIDRGGF